MEDGGASLFHFVENAHKWIKAKVLDIPHWIEVVKVIFKQMIECIAFIHSKNICHFDISLENFVINNVNADCRVYGEAGKEIVESIQFELNDIQVKLCDFGTFFFYIFIRFSISSLFICSMYFLYVYLQTGLAEGFKTNECKSNKYCGKRYYQSPEIVNGKKQFDAKKNDIWSVGVVLFMMLTHIVPWETADESNEAYKWMTNGFMKELLKHWGLLKFVNDDLLDLFKGIFRFEANRMSLKQIQMNKWMKE